MNNTKYMVEFLGCGVEFLELGLAMVAVFPTENPTLFDSQIAADACAISTRLPLEAKTVLVNMDEMALAV